RAAQQDQQPDADQLERTGRTGCPRQEAEHHQAEAEVVRLGERVQPGHGVREAQQADRAREKEERADGHGHDGEKADRGGHAPRAPLSGASGERGLPFLTKAMAANVASSASVSATSAVAPAPAAVPSSSRPAMPPVPSSWAAIIRSALPGPRSTRISPSATMARTNPDAASRNSVIARRSAQRAGQHRLLRGELCDHRLLHVDTVVEQRTAGLAGGSP